MAGANVEDTQDVYGNAQSTQQDLAPAVKAYNPPPAPKDTPQSRAALAGPSSFWGRIQEVGIGKIKLLNVADTAKKSGVDLGRLAKNTAESTVKSVKQVGTDATSSVKKNFDALTQPVTSHGQQTLKLQAQVQQLAKDGKVSPDTIKLISQLQSPADHNAALKQIAANPDNDKANQAYIKSLDEQQTKQTEKEAGDVGVVASLAIPGGAEAKTAEEGGKLLVDKVGSEGVKKLADKAGVDVADESPKAVQEAATKVAKTSVGKQAIKALGKESTSTAARALKAGTTGAATTGLFGASSAAQQGASKKEVVESGVESAAFGAVAAGGGSLAHSAFNKVTGKTTAGKGLLASLRDNPDARGDNVEKPNPPKVPSTTKINVKDGTEQKQIGAGAKKAPEVNAEKEAYIKMYADALKQSDDQSKPQSTDLYKRIKAAGGIGKSDYEDTPSHLKKAGGPSGDHVAVTLGYSSEDELHDAIETERGVRDAAKNAPKTDYQAEARQQLDSGKADSFAQEEYNAIKETKTADIKGNAPVSKSRAKTATVTPNKLTEAASKATSPPTTKSNDKTAEASDKNVQELIAKHQESPKFNSDIRRGADSVEGNKLQIQHDATKVLKSRNSLSVADKKDLQDYRDQKAAGLTPQPLSAQLTKEDADTTALNAEAQKADAENARLSGNEQKAKIIEERDPSTYTHRVAKDKGSTFDYLLQGDRNNPSSVSRFGRSKAGDKARTFHAITDEKGKRTVVAIKTAKNQFGKSTGEKRVFAVSKDGAKDLGALKPKIAPKVTEFTDQKVSESLNKTADDLGITHVRTNKNFTPRKAAGISFTGANKVMTRAGAPERVLIHEIGHQLDEKYDLQKMFKVRNSKEIRALSDLRVGDNATKSFSKYVRSGDEKVAVMFEAYLHTPEKFQEVAPQTYKQFTAFLGSHEELKPLADLKPSLVLGRNVIGEDAVPGEFTDKAGNKYSVGDATTKEITQATGQKYYIDPKLTAVANYVDSRSALENARFMETMKTAPEFKEVAAAPDETAPKGWKTVDNLPQFTGYRFEPKTAEVLTDIAGSGKSEADIAKSAGKFLRQTIVYFPVKHDLNMATAYVADRGVTGIVNPAKAARGVMSLFKATDDVIHQTPFYQKLLKSGFSLPSADDHAFEKEFSSQLSKLVDNKSALNGVARELGTTPERLASAYTKTQHVSVWQVQDILNIARIRERMMSSPLKTGMSFDDAVKDTEKFNFQYKVPSRVAGSRQMARFLKSDMVFFGPYRYDQFKMFSNTLKAAVKVNDPKGAAEAWDKLGILAIGTTLMMPVINKGLQAIAGDKNAHLSAPGPLAIPADIEAVKDGTASLLTELGNQIDISQAIQMPLDIKHNIDSFTGKTIYDPNASLPDQIKSVADWIGSQLAPTQKLKGTNNATNRAAAAILSLSGATLPKNSPGTDKLYSLEYDTLPSVEATAKAQYQQGDAAGAQKTASQYNTMVLAATKNALKQAGKPVPSDQVLIARLKYNYLYYSPSQRTVKGYQSGNTPTLLDKLSQ
jgi:hypothetical protein